ncbi:major facilitator superfamily transporter [Bacillus altitudinis]|uniref:MFS transporter n=1 Tax=Bacillus TaxID=1386 RepID=UPI0007205618|nr:MULTISPECIES: MFS transporter [Bacillus]BAT48864.1 major facilitator superfamily transporter [Bacillus pumilus]APP16971.1 MFS transporter [Bacillus altitudinis]MBG9903379.1 MFS transporter [Bacillus altitudinis]MBL7242466.1 MFS transporter [Bacillus altitudinis]MBR0629394.1 MFS transporter [Bacillus altitudinis S70-5-12]
MKLKWYKAIIVIFTMSGISISTWFSRTPEVRDLLQADTGTMGLILLGLSVGSIVGLILSNVFVRKKGGRVAIVVSAFLMFIGFSTLAIGAALSSTLIVTAGLFLFGSGSGMCNVAMNLEGTEIEYQIKRTILPILHASFSIGTLIGAGAGILFIYLGVSVFIHLLTIALLFFLSILICTRFIPHGTGKDQDETQTESVEASQTSWLNKRTISLAMIALCLAFVEGSANDWIPLAMVDGYQVSHSMSTVIYALFLCGMISGRLLSGRFIDRFGRVLLLRIAILSAAAGLFLVILKISLVVCMISIFLWGLGASLGFPLTISAAGDDSRYAVKRVSIVTLSGYTASLSGPPVLGLLANQVGLLHAFIFVLFAICIAGIFTKAVAKPTSIHSF